MLINVLKIIREHECIYINNNKLVTPQLCCKLNIFTLVCTNIHKNATYIAFSIASRVVCSALCRAAALCGRLGGWGVTLQVIFEELLALGTYSSIDKIGIKVVACRLITSRVLPFKTFAEVFARLEDRER